MQSEMEARKNNTKPVRLLQDDEYLSDNDE
jgi:hypothetical protein